MLSLPRKMAMVRRTVALYDPAMVAASPGLHRSWLSSTNVRRTIVRLLSAAAVSGAMVPGAMACGPVATGWASVPPTGTFQGTVAIKGSQPVSKHFTLKIPGSCKAWASGVASVGKQKRIQLPAPLGEPLVSIGADNWHGPGTYSNRATRGIAISMAVGSAVLYSPKTWSLKVASNGDGHFDFTRASGYSSINGKAVTASGTDTWTCR